MGPTYEQILVEHRTRAVRVTLNLPDRRNALTATMARELVDALGSAVADGALVAIITGAGKGFCSGGDVAGMASGFGGGPAASAAQVRDGVLGYYRQVLQVAELPIPTIAAVNGAAVGAGLNLALACDIRIAGDRASFAASFLRIGLPPGMGATWLLSRVVGTALAAELIYTGRRVDAVEAERIGLANRMVAADELDAQAWELAGQIAAGPPIALRMAKQALRLAATSDHETVLQFEAMSQAAVAGTDDLREGLTAFLEKRSPEFHGR